ncbi:docking protein 2-like [Dreissena polymorpha]|uniref:IRS-type PTB domain-containing protein n=1 Tax=Dreissena polymorpha TaxID=45954 RepID=A0A9D4EUM9_DREPO|nr:docking protein 2-like [Dreissena polymorpha]KAH3786567.1 hypothetical protein DPMN_164674 [Dreissena polymorpha]
MATFSQSPVDKGEGTYLNTSIKKDEGVWGRVAQAQPFSVNVEPCQLAKLCDIEGAMTMFVTNQCISFEDPKTRQNKYLFQLSWIRRFGQRNKDQFYFECGRKCPNGEGTVTCISQSAAEIYKVITTKSSSNVSTVIPGKQKVKGLDEKKALDLKPSEKLLDVKPKVSSPAPKQIIKYNKN